MNLLFEFGEDFFAMIDGAGQVNWKACVGLASLILAILFLFFI